LRKIAADHEKKKVEAASVIRLRQKAIASRSLDPFWEGGPEGKGKTSTVDESRPGKGGRKKRGGSAPSGRKKNPRPCERHEEK